MTITTSAPAPRERTRGPGSVSPTLDRLAAYSWRLLAVASAIVALVWLTGQLLLVVVPCAVAGLIARGLWPVARAMRNRGMRPGLAAIFTLLGFVVVLAGVLGLAGGSIAGEVDQIGPTVTEGIDELTDWLVDDSPFDVSRADVERIREQAGDTLTSAAGADGGGVATGAVLAFELVAGSLLSLIIAFFLLKDGHRWFERFVRAFPEHRRERVGRSFRRGWDAAGGYLKGAAVLGVVEGIVIGVTLLLVGSSLVAPVMLITFLAAFIPIVGAVVAGIIATLVALVTAGTVPALIVAGVTIVVQQLDNDLLAPVIYGKAIRLHPLVILLGIVAGGALFGFVGTFFAVPFLAVTLNAFAGYRDSSNGEASDAASPDGRDSDVAADIVVR
jgi:predicted PurR-regulated permease PerM